MQSRLRKLYFYFTILIGYGEIIAERDQGTAMELLPGSPLPLAVPLQQVYALATIASLSCWVLSASQPVVRGGWRVWIHSKKCSI